MNIASIKTRLITALLSVATATCFAQQDIQFSQYMFNPLVLNTAYAGYRGESYANFMYRKQWVDLKGAPETFAASVEWLMPNQDERVAWSAKVMSDKLGPQKTMSGFLGYTYRVPLDEYGARRLCLGLSGGVTQYSVDGNAFQYVDNNDDLVPVGVSSKVTPDFNAGAYYYTPKVLLKCRCKQSAGCKGYQFAIQLAGYTFRNYGETYTWVLWFGPYYSAFRCVLNSDHLSYGKKTLMVRATLTSTHIS